MPSPHTLAETEEQVAGKVGALPLDVEAMAAISNLFRAANATRNYLERSVLAASGLSWTAFVVLWVTSRVCSAPSRARATSSALVASATGASSTSR